MRTRWLPVLALAVLAPVCAEYLWGYDDSTGHPAALVGNLFVFTPLYGCPALLIREVARRRDLGWLGIVLLAAAFGVVEAGLVDQSMFSRDYRDIPYWHEMADPTYVAPIGLSIFLAVTFVANHVLASMVGPIAVVEGLAGARGRDPWLGRPMVVVAALLYAAAAAAVLQDMLSTEGAIASPGQLVGAGAVAVVLVAAAVRIPRLTRDLGTSGVLPRSRSAGIPGGPGIPAQPWQPALAAAVAAALAAGGAQLLPPSPLGTDALMALYAASAAVVWWISRRPGWSPRHVSALAAGWLAAFAMGAFGTDPIGDVSRDEKLGHNVALLVLMVCLGALAVRRAGDRQVRVSVTG